MASRNYRQNNRLANLGSPHFDGRPSSRGYAMTPERTRFLLDIDALVRSGRLAEALRRHTEARDFRVTGRQGSWALCDHAIQGDKLRFLLGARPDRGIVAGREIVSE